MQGNQKITTKQMEDAIAGGLPVTVLINGEYYEWIPDKPIEPKMPYWTAIAQTGDRIDCFCTREEAEKAIKEYEAQDIEDNAYEGGFYEIEYETDDGDYYVVS